MKSALPKVLHRCAGAPLIRYVLDAVAAAGIDEVVIVIGNSASLVREALGEGYRYAYQEQQLGTGDAVARALPELSPACRELLVLCGDTPLLTSGTLNALLKTRRAAGADACILTSLFENPSGYGRIVRDASGLVAAIVEDGDATAEQREIREINTGTYAFDRQALEAALPGLRPDNSQGEYYLTDVIAMLRRSGRPVAAVAATAAETAGINTRRELAAVERIIRQRECERVMDSGVTIIDPAVTYIDPGVEVGRDTVIYPMCFLESNTRIGQNCVIGPGTRLINAVLGDRVAVQSSLLVECTIGDGCQIGPFAYLRPGTVLAERVKVGDFVELKQAVVGCDSKIPHLSYVGDAVIGAGVNVGAGTITCNYDGVNKHQTTIGDGAFIGSNTNLVAPVTIGREAVTGAGSTITKDVPDSALAVERARQTVVPDWRRARAAPRRGAHPVDGRGTRHPAGDR
jgi:bifunctional UDP-N-acetylglucosamine pyrophosphorylase/glucosamine-1-phosphate N-acetyltransferase